MLQVEAIDRQCTKAETFLDPEPRTQNTVGGLPSMIRQESLCRYTIKLFGEPEHSVSELKAEIIRAIEHYFDCSVEGKGNYHDSSAEL